MISPAADLVLTAKFFPRLGAHTVVATMAGVEIRWAGLGTALLVCEE